MTSNGRPAVSRCTCTGAFLSHFMRHRKPRALETRSPRIRIEFFDLVDNLACHVVPLLADLDPSMPSVNSQRTLRVAAELVREGPLAVIAGALQRGRDSDRRSRFFPEDHPDDRRRHRSRRSDGLKPDASSVPRLNRARANARPRLRQAPTTRSGAKWLSQSCAGRAKAT